MGVVYKREPQNMEGTGESLEDSIKETHLTGRQVGQLGKDVKGAGLEAGRPGEKAVAVGCEFEAFIELGW